MALKMKKLKRYGCPPTLIPLYTGHTWECPEKDLELYTLGDGTKCCRSPSRTRKKKITEVEEGVIRPKKDIGYKPKEKLQTVVEKPDDPTKILNPRTGRWVNKSGKVGKEILAGKYQ